jgi:di/tricarboxylate transporter
MGASYIPFALATAVGSNLSISTPVATPSTSLIYSLGYRFMDYIKFGGLINVIGTVGAAFALKVLYFM